MAQDEQDSTFPYSSAFARANARLTAALDHGAMVLMAPLVRLGVDFAVPPQPPAPRLAPKPWIPLTLCAVTVGVAAWQVLGPYHRWAMATVWFFFMLSSLRLNTLRARHPILSKPADDRTAAERRIVGQCWMTLAVTIAALSSCGLALIAFHVLAADKPINGMELGRRIMIGLLYTECLAFMTPVIVLSWHDHRPDDAFPRLADMKKPFSEPVR